MPATSPVWVSFQRDTWVSFQSDATPMNVLPRHVALRRCHYHGRTGMQRWVGWWTSGTTSAKNQSLRRKPMSDDGQTDLASPPPIENLS
jgi:hypothetical protein